MSDIQHGSLSLYGIGKNAIVSLTSTQGDASVTSTMPLAQTQGNVFDLKRLSAENETKLAEQQG